MKKLFAVLALCGGLAACNKTPVNMNDPNQVVGKNSVMILTLDSGECKIYDLYRTYVEEGILYRYSNRDSQINICRGAGHPSTNEYRSGKTTQHNHTIFEENL